jgi:hypothetical protein
MHLMKKRAVFTGMLNRVPPQSEGEKPSYLLVESVQTGTIDGQPGGIANVPIVVQAPAFGREDLAGYDGPVRVTVLIEQIPGK